jgi:hypothetical protein
LALYGLPRFIQRDAGSAVGDEALLHLLDVAGPPHVSTFSLIVFPVDPAFKLPPSVELQMT